MKTYYVNFNEKLGADHEWFKCKADDMLHAREQCENAYPEAFIFFVLSTKEFKERYALERITTKNRCN